MITARTVAAATLAASVALLGAACSDDSGTGPTTGNNDSSQDQTGGELPDVCTLLTLEEASAHAGEELTQVKTSAESGANPTAFPMAGCTWDSPDSRGFILITIYRESDSMTTFDATVSIMDGTTPVSGVGDKAIINGRGDIWVKNGQLIITVSDYAYDGDLTDLAKTVISRLP